MRKERKSNAQIQRTYGKNKTKKKKKKKKRKKDDGAEKKENMKNF